MQIKHWVALFFFVAAGFPAVASAQDILGVWRTHDASSDEGRQQGGIVFRANNTGEFISPTLAGSDKTAEDMLKYLETITGGSTNLKFKYTYENSIVSITVTHMGSVPVSGSNMIAWKAQVSGRELKLTAQDGSGKWLLLTKI